jgi:hypothetical protein
MSTLRCIKVVKSLIHQSIYIEQLGESLPENSSKALNHKIVLIKIKRETKDVNSAVY